MGRQLNKYVASQLEQKAIPRIKRPKAAQILVVLKGLKFAPKNHTKIPKGG